MTLEEADLKAKSIGAIFYRDHVVPGVPEGHIFRHYMINQEREMAYYCIPMQTWVEFETYRTWHPSFQTSMPSKRL